MQESILRYTGVQPFVVTRDSIKVNTNEGCRDIQLTLRGILSQYCAQCIVGRKFETSISNNSVQLINQSSNVCERHTLLLPLVSSTLIIHEMGLRTQYQVHMNDNPGKYVKL